MLASCCKSELWCGKGPEEQICSVCGSGEVEDEEHVLLKCTAYSSLRLDSGLDFSQGMRGLLLGPEQGKLAVLLLGHMWASRHACLCTVPTLSWPGFMTLSSPAACRVLFFCIDPGAPASWLVYGSLHVDWVTDPPM